MRTFQKAFFKSDDTEIDDTYLRGVRHLEKYEHYAADKCFRAAATGGHISAYYNLFLLNGGGFISPYDIDFAADCFYKAASAGHSSASKHVFMLEAADRAGFGINNLTHLAATTKFSDGLSAHVMVFACRFLLALSKTHGAMDEVIAYELDGASRSDNYGILDFVKRTGVPERFYKGPLSNLENGSAADIITDGFNHFTVALSTAGYPPKVAAMARCSVLGYLISKSPHGWNSEPLVGLDRFFSS